MSEPPSNANADAQQRDSAERRDSLSMCHQAPLLLIPDEQDHIWKAYDVMKEKFLDLKLSVPYERRFCGSLEGWLIGVNRDSTVTLYKPGHTNSTVHLPCIFPRKFKPEIEREPDFIDPAGISDYHVQRAIVKSDENELTVVAIYGEFDELAYIRHGKDATWSKINVGSADEPFMTLDVLHYKNKFYAISNQDVLISFNVTDSLTTIELVTHEIEESTLYSHEGKKKSSK